MRGAIWAAWLAGALLVAAPAAGEMYRCKGRDGRTLYTSDKSQCPGAERHEPTGLVHSVPTRPGGVRPKTRPAASYDADAIQAATWGRKKRKAQEDLAAASQRLPTVLRAVNWCNRGLDLYVEDDLGIRKNYECSDVRREARDLEAAAKQLDAYLNQGGLEEECRRAGCLPGWIRD